MSYTFVSPAIASSFLKVKWREQYGSAGINKKLYGIVPHGIYRGLTLSTSGSDNTITVVPDVAQGDHLGVYETADGYSVTLRDDTSTTYSLALTDAGLLSQTVVIAIFVEYTPGSTSATFVAYTVAEYDLLPAPLRNELIVLGTVVNPAAGNVVATISDDRRTLASMNQPLVTWRPLLANAGFERSGAAGVITGLEVDGWSSTGSWNASSTGVEDGTRCVEFSPTGAVSGASEQLLQLIGTSVVSGQKILVRVSKKVVAASSTGNGQVVVIFTGDGGGSAATQTKNFVITSTDSSYQDADYYFTAPAGAITLKAIGVGIDNATYGSGGAKVRVDNVQAYLEPKSPTGPFEGMDERQRALYSTGLIVEDGSATSFNDRGSLLWYKKNVPTNEGALRFSRKDLDYSGGKLPPTLEVDGRITEVGTQMLGSTATRLLPRFSAPFDTSGYTLMSENALVGESLGGYTQPVYREFLIGNGNRIITVNASHDATVWNKDVTGAEAFQFYFDGASWSSSFMDAATDSWGGWNAMGGMYAANATSAACWVNGVYYHDGLMTHRVPPSMWIEPASGFAHTHLFNYIQVETSTDALYAPIQIPTVGPGIDGGAIIDRFRIRFGKNTSDSYEVEAFIVEVVDGVATPVGISMNNADNAPGIFTWESDPGQNISLSSMAQYYLKFNPSGGVAPAKDKIYGLEVDWVQQRP